MEFLFGPVDEVGVGLLVVGVVRVGDDGPTVKYDVGNGLEMGEAFVGSVGIGVETGYAVLYDELGVDIGGRVIFPFTGAADDGFRIDGDAVDCNFRSFPFCPVALAKTVNGVSKRRIDKTIPVVANQFNIVTGKDFFCFSSLAFMRPHQ